MDDESDSESNENNDKNNSHIIVLENTKNIQYFLSISFFCLYDLFSTLGNFK